VTADLFSAVVVVDHLAFPGLVVLPVQVRLSFADLDGRLIRVDPRAGFVACAAAVGALSVQVAADTLEEGANWPEPAYAADRC
jgi:hypothetical protein